MWLVIIGTLLLPVAGSPAPAQPLAGPSLPPTPAERPNWGLGPIDFRDEQVFSLLHLSLAADTPLVLAPGQFSFALRTDLAKTIATYDDNPAILDVETVSVAPIVRIGLVKRLELRAELPASYRWEGITDPLARRTETIFGTIRPEHEHLSDNHFQVNGLNDDGRFFELNKGLGLSKLRLGLKVALTEGGAFVPAASAEWVVGLPTGTGDFGTGGTDLGIRLALSKRFTDFVVYSGVAGLFPGGDPRPIRLVSWQVVPYLGGEFDINRYLAFIYQGWYETPQTLNLDGRGGAIVYHGGGLKLLVGPTWAEVGFLHEGGDFKRTADFTFHAEVGITF